MFLYRDINGTIGRFLIVAEKRDIEGFEFVQNITQVLLMETVECNSGVTNCLGKANTFLID